MGIFPKTFAYTLCLMLAIVLLSHLLIFFLMPPVYNERQEEKLDTDVRLLAEQIPDASFDEAMAEVAAFAAKWEANVDVVYEDFSYRVDLSPEQMVSAVSDDGYSTLHVVSSVTENGLRVSVAENVHGGADIFQIQYSFPDDTGEITASVSRERVEDAVTTILQLLPFTAVLCGLLCLPFAWAYSRTITKPIRELTHATEEMRELKPDVRCANGRKDEIGVLGNNMDEVYWTLLTTIQSLQEEIAKAEAADVQKMNFLRAASHELKTPVTAIGVMLENMLLKVGRYRDTQTYLSKCKAMTDELAVMIRDILDASRAELGERQAPEEFSVLGDVEAMLEPYEILAKAKGVSIRLKGEQSFKVWLPRKMFEKVVSNILANAVSYAEPGSTVEVMCLSGHMSVKNACSPIPPEHLAHIFEPFYRPDYGRGRSAGGNGLGLYLAAAILNALDLSFTFEPLQDMNGMSFDIFF